MKNIPRLLDTALLYGRLGWAVLPCHSPIFAADMSVTCSCGKLDKDGKPACTSIGKHPRTVNGVKDATKDEATVRSWWKRWPEANVGIATGTPSGIWALDVDAKHEGDETLCDLEKANGSLPSTPTSITGSKGAHYLFALPPGLTIGSPTGVALGIDVRGEGTFIVAPPSVYRTGSRYTWEVDHRPGDVEPVAAPAWLVGLVTTGRKVKCPTAPIPAVIREGDRRARLLSIAGTLRRRGATESEILDALRAMNRPPRFPEPLPDAEVQELARDVAARYDPATGSAPSNGEAGAPTTSDPDMPTIQLSMDLLRDAQAAECALGRSGREVFSRGGGVGLVRIHRDPTTTAATIRREAGTPIIGPLEPVYCRALLSNVATWTKTKSDGEAVRVRPPADVAGTMLALGTWPSLRPLTGIVTAPVLRPDGTVLDRPGYDATTGLLAEFPAACFPAIPDEPTRDDVYSALDSLREVFENFPFVDTCDRSAAIAGILTLFARPALDGSVPVFAWRATAQGTGKSLGVDASAIIATGRTAPRMADAGEEDEYRKRLLALALAGDPLVLVDNIMRPFGCGALAMAITGRTIRDRLLGETRIVEAPFDAVVFATGNGMTFTGDLPRRVVPVDLDAGIERPEERTGFKHADLLAWTREHRPQLAAAALTILRAHAVADRPSNADLTAFGGFEQWGRVVRNAVVWCGLPDPCLGRARIAQAADPEKESLLRFLTAWRAVQGDSAETLEAAWKRTDKQDDELAAAMRALDYRAKADAAPSLRAVGNWLQSRLGRIVGGLRLRALPGTRGGCRLWRVERTEGTEGSNSTRQNEEDQDHGPPSAPPDGRNQSPQSPQSPAEGRERVRL